MEQIREQPQTRPEPRPRGQAAPAPVDRDHVGVFEQKDGRSYVGLAPKAGRICGHQLRRVATLADGFGAGRVRTTTQQKMVILDVPGERVEELVADIGFVGAVLPRGDGTRSDGFLVHPGGTLGATPRFGRKVRGVRVRRGPGRLRRDAAPPLRDSAERAPQLRRVRERPRRREARFLHRPGRWAVSSATPRAVPLHCPYCGETDLRPGGETDGEWHCRICARTFRLTFLGLGGEETHFATEGTP